MLISQFIALKVKFIYLFIFTFVLDLITQLIQIIIFKVIDIWKFIIHYFFVLMLINAIFMKKTHFLKYKIKVIYFIFYFYCKYY
jgi:hypothetical protein